MMNPQQTFCQPLTSHAMVTMGPTNQGMVNNSNKLDDDNSSTEDDMSEDTLTVEDEPATEHMSKMSAVVHPNDGSQLPRMVPTSSVHDGAHMAHAQHIGNGSMRIDQRDDSTEDEKKREHKKRSKNWTRAETLNLIQARAELDEKFRKTGRKVPLWDDISCSLRRAGFNRDGQQCKDKWEKLMAGYKEVRDGTRDKANHPFYEELHPLLSWKSYKRENESPGDTIDGSDKRVKLDTGSVPGVPSWKQSMPSMSGGQIALEMGDARKEELISPMASLQSTSSMSVIDLAVIQELLDTIIMRQQRFFKELLDAVERKEQCREQMRHVREEKWRAEERAQRYAFNNAMLMLTQRLLGERATTVSTAVVPVPVPGTGSGSGPLLAAVAPSNSPANPKKRSKNWKKSEVFNLIRFRREMESKFVKSTRRAGLWEELGEKLSSLGINRDGKQCREKWDKLMAEYKDVVDGRKDKEESPYFAELTKFLGKSKEVEVKSSQEPDKEEAGEI